MPLSPCLCSPRWTEGQRCERHFTPLSKLLPITMSRLMGVFVCACICAQEVTDCMLHVQKHFISACTAAAARIRREGEQRPHATGSRPSFQISAAVFSHLVGGRLRLQCPTFDAVAPSLDVEILQLLSARLRGGISPCGSPD